MARVVLWAGSPLEEYLREENALSQHETVVKTDNLRQLFTHEAPPATTSACTKLSLWLIQPVLLRLKEDGAIKDRLAVNHHDLSWSIFRDGRIMCILAFCGIAFAFGYEYLSNLELFLIILSIGFVLLVYATLQFILCNSISLMLEAYATATRLTQAARELEAESKKCPGPFDSEARQHFLEIARQTLEELTNNDQAPILDAVIRRFRLSARHFIDDIQRRLCLAAMEDGITSIVKELLSLYLTVRHKHRILAKFSRDALDPLLTLYTGRKASRVQLKAWENELLALRQDSICRYPGPRSASLVGALGPGRSFLEETKMRAQTPRSALLEHAKRYSAAVLAANYHLGEAAVRLRASANLRYPESSTLKALEEIERIKRNVKESFIYVEQAEDALLSVLECNKPAVKECTPKTSENLWRETPPVAAAPSPTIATPKVARVVRSQFYKAAALIDPVSTVNPSISDIGHTKVPEAVLSELQDKFRQQKVNEEEEIEIRELVDGEPQVSITTMKTLTQETVADEDELLTSKGQGLEDPPPQIGPSEVFRLPDVVHSRVFAGEEFTAAGDNSDDSSDLIDF